MKPLVGSDLQAAPAGDTSAARLAYDEVDPRSESRWRRLFGWAWRCALIGFVIVLVSPPAQAGQGTHAQSRVATLSAR